MLRTSSFRLALMYAGITGASFLVLFSVTFWSTTRFMQHQVDSNVTSEIGEIRDEIEGVEGERSAALVQDLARHSQEFVYLLQEANGEVAAGNLPSMTPVPGLRELVVHPQGSRPIALRGTGVLLGGRYLFVGSRTHQIEEMGEFIIGSFLWGFAASLALAVAGGLIMSNRLLRRVQSVSDTSLKIISGDLSQRIPVARSGDEFDNLSASVNAMLDRIQSLMSDLQQVTSDIAHDMRTPLTRLRQRLEQTQRSDAGTELLRDTLARTIVEIDAILGIFAALLRIAQIDGKSLPSTASATDLSDLMSRAAELYRSNTEEKRQTLVEDYQCAVSVEGDSQLLMQLFANLIENAIVHCPPGARIELSTRREGSRVVAAVADDGPGIPSALRDKVLLRFFRLESSRTSPGNGLGLSLSAAIVKLHNAEMTLSDSAPGLTISIAFPAHR